MLKAELNAYLGVLKTTAKSSRLDTLKCVASHDGVLEATNLDFFARLKANFPEGVYNNKILDLIKVAPSADLEPYQEHTLDDWVELHPSEPLGEIDLSPETPYGSYSDIVAHAAEFISSDSTRPALMTVNIANGEIAATDGYRAYISQKLPIEQSCNLIAPLLKAFRKVAKYGKWTLTIYEDMVKLDNGEIALFAKQCSKPFPPVRGLMNDNRTFTHKVVIPYSQLKPLISKTDNELVIKPNGEMTLGGRPLPLLANVVPLADPYQADIDCFRAVLCGLSNHPFDVACNATYLATYRTDKDGNITLYANYGTQHNTIYDMHEPTLNK